MFAGSAFVAERTGCETPTLEVTRSKTIRNKISLIRVLFISSLISLDKAAFCCVLDSVCGAQTHSLFKLAFS